MQVRHILGHIKRKFVRSAVQAPSLSREEKLLANIRKDGPGVEIGPAFRPVAPRGKGFNVTIIDHADRAQLIAKYKSQGIDCSRIEEVDYIWNGEPYVDLLGKQQAFDWVIASHVIEHATDLIGFLKDCESILASTGSLSLAIPDKRFCFDRFRPKTGLARVIDAHRNPGNIHSEGTVAEYYLNVVRRGEAIAWANTDENIDDLFAFVHTDSEARNAVEITRCGNQYLDVHAWTFTPNSFRVLVHDLRHLGFIKLHEKAFHDTVGHEFFITLSKQPPEKTLDRMQLLKASYDEGY